MPSFQSSAVAPLVVRDLSSASELRDAETLQKEVWGIGDLDVVPLNQFVAARAAGGVLVGAFDESTLVGFAYGFPSIDENGPAMHSHLLAVRPAYRRRRIGYDLKLAQRERTLAKGLTRMTWTFDPLRPINAHFNFARLGVVSDRYLPDFYGEESDSALDRHGTDRLWVTWFLDSVRVTTRLYGESSPAAPHPLSHALPLLQIGPDGSPVGLASRDPGARDVAEAAESSVRSGLGGRLFIEIPGTIRQDGEADFGDQWRRATRAAFTSAIDAGYRVEEFYAPSSRLGVTSVGARQSGAYILAPRGDGSS